MVPILETVGGVAGKKNQISLAVEFKSTHNEETQWKGGECMAITVDLAESAQEEHNTSDREVFETTAVGGLCGQSNTVDMLKECVLSVCLRKGQVVEAKFSLSPSEEGNLLTGDQKLADVMTGCLGTLHLREDESADIVMGDLDGHLLHSQHEPHSKVVFTWITKKK